MAVAVAVAVAAGGAGKPHSLTRTKIFACEKPETYEGSRALSNRASLPWNLVVPSIYSSARPELD